MHKDPYEYDRRTHAPDHASAEQASGWMSQGSLYTIYRCGYVECLLTYASVLCMVDLVRWSRYSRSGREASLARSLGEAGGDAGSVLWGLVWRAVRVLFGGGGVCECESD